MARINIGDGFINVDDNIFNAQTQMYNMLGRDAGSAQSSDNIFARRAKSIDNAIGTTGAAIASDLKSGGVLFKGAENIATEDLLRDTKARMDDIAKKYGYNTYQDVWDARDAAQAAGDQATLDKIDNVINPELQNQANVNAQRANEKAANYADYMQNNDVSRRINQDPGKFLGSAINTLSTAFDVMAPGAGVLANSVQGGIEGIADELEQSGLQNFNAERAAQNALVGTATGAVVGGLNKGVTNSLAKRGGNLFKGGNAITRGLNNLGSQTALGRAGSTIATGVGRGALSGAVGGATGAGLSAALNNQDVLGSALQGASQGLQQGALAGGVMAGAGLVGNKVSNAINDFRAESDNGFGRRYNQFAGKGNEAIDYLLKRGGGEVEGAVRSPAVEAITGDGNVDLVYGKTGDDGYGLAHIVEKHGVDIAKKIPSILENGNVVDDPRYTNNNRITLASDDNTGAVRLGWDGNKKQWVVTAYEGLPYSSASSANNQIANSAALRGSSVQGQNDATVGSTIPQSEQNVNDLTQVFEPSGVKQIEKQNILQFVGNRVKEAGDAQKYMALYNSLDKSTAEDVASRKIPQTLTALGVNPENYEAYAETSTYVNKVISDMADKSGVRVNAPDLAKKLSYDNIANDDITLSDTALKKYKQNVSRIVETGKDMNYSAGDLLRESRRMGQLAQNVSGNADDKVALRKLYNRDKWILRDLATSALDEAGLFGDQTDSNIATGLARMGANQKVQDYYTAAIDGKSPSAADYIRRTAPFESAREMAIEMKSEPLTRSASKTPTNPLTMIYRSSGLEQPMNTLLSYTVAPVAGGLTKLAGKGIEGVGNLASKVNGAGTSLTPATTTVASNNYNPATQIYNAIGRTEGLTNGEQARTANYLVEAANNMNSNANTLESLVTPTLGDTTSVYSTMSGTGTVTPTYTSIEEERARYFYPPTGDYWTDMLSQAMRNAKNAEDYDALGSLYEMYQDALSNNKSSAKTVSDLSATQQAQLAKLDSADSAIDELETLFDRAGGGKGPIIGNLQSIAGDWGWDSNARTYNQLSEGLINQIALAIGKTDSLNTEGEVKRALQLIPQLTDDATTAKNKLEELRKMLATTKSSYNTAYGLTSI